MIIYDRYIWVKSQLNKGLDLKPGVTAKLSLTHFVGILHTFCSTYWLRS